MIISNDIQNLYWDVTLYTSVEFEHHTHWAIKKFNFDIQHGGLERRLRLTELEKIHNDAYENAKNYKQHMKIFHDKHK